MEQKPILPSTIIHITVERLQTACGREIRSLSVFPGMAVKPGGQAESPGRTGLSAGKSCVRKVLDNSNRSGIVVSPML